MTAPSSKSPSPAQRRRGLLPWIAAGLASLIAGLWVQTQQHPQTGKPEVAAVLSAPRPLPEFTLTDLDGAPLDRTRLLGHYTLLFFGYTNCPDVCPTVLAELAIAKRSLADLPAALQPTVLFVSVDPARDSPEVLGRYVRHFNAAFLAATGTDDALTRIATSVGAIYQRSTPVDGSYNVDHSAAMFLVDPKAALIAVFPAPHVAKQIVNDYRLIVHRTTDQPS